jgi:hypothetical protein
MKNGSSLGPVILARQSFLNCAEKFGFGNGCDGGELCLLFLFFVEFPGQVQ